MKIYFIYEHRTLDTNEVFYIGYGYKKEKTKQNRINPYQRSKDKYARGKFWHNIVNKHGYEINIIFETANQEDAFNKEIELIKLYGRRDLKTGSLVNLTDGGEVNNGRTFPKRKIKVSSFDNTGNLIKSYNSVTDAVVENDITHSYVHKQCVGLRKYSKIGIRFRYFDSSVTQIEACTSSTRICTKKVNQFTVEGVFIKEYNSTIEASRLTDISNSAIRNCCYGLSKTAGKYKWSFKINN